MEDIIKFSNFLNKFRLVQRRLFVNSEERRENDIEHSYQLAMLAWYIIRKKNLDLNMEKIFMYSLAHDLVEVYAGDTWFFTQNNEDIENKSKKEEEALEIIMEEFPEFSELHDVIKGYERREDPEAKFVYALDKLQPIINIYLDKGRTWKINNVDFDMVSKNKREKIKGQKEVLDYFEELMKIVEREKENLFTTY